MRWGLRIKSFDIIEGHWKIQIEGNWGEGGVGVGGSQKINKKEGMHKNGRGA